MNPFTQIADTLSARAQQRPAFPRAAKAPDAKKPSKTQAMRDYLRDHGPANAFTLADEVGLERSDLVSALLAKDLISGSIERVGDLYRINTEYDAMVRAGQEDMARTLRRAGWTVTPPTKPADHQSGPFTEAITWFDVTADGPMPDAFETVLCELEDNPEPVWAGCWDGDSWCDAECVPFTGLVTAWARMPGGRNGGARHG